MSTEDNKALIRRFYEEVFNKKNMAAIDDFIAPNQVDDAKQTITMYLTAFPDLQVTVEDMIAEGDKVVARLTARGTHQGAFLGIPPTGKQGTGTGIEINRITGGKSIEHWVEMDTLGLLQQLGVVPVPGQARESPR
jgi:predicted ester cyclase